MNLYTILILYYLLTLCIEHSLYIYFLRYILYFMINKHYVRVQLFVN